MEYLVAALMGLAGGMIGGVLGVGGGILFVPALAVVLDLPQIEAVSTSLVAVIPVGLVGAWRQQRFGNLELRDGLWIGVLAPPGVVAGVLLANAVSERVLELSFAALLLVIATQLARRGLSSPSASPRARP
jgi:uncharacterized membrane protein YfcA